MTDEQKQSRREERQKRRENQNNEAKTWYREWLDALLFAAVAAIIIRAFFFEAYTIPTPSMEKSLLVGDYLVVSKINYGARTPMVLGVPFTNINLTGLTLPWTRLPGFGDVERNDVVVFNYPIDTGPIAAKTNYVKRAIGVPGDTLAIRDKNVFINNKNAATLPTMQQHYRVTVKDRVRLSAAKVNARGGTLIDEIDRNAYRINMTAEMAKSMQQWPEVESVAPFVLPDDYNEFTRVGFNFAQAFQNHHQLLPPIVVPFEGQTITLTDQNWPIYENIITRYEKQNARRLPDGFMINGERTDRYTIQQDYYFMMGDNRDNSQDSRFWGFVPHDHIIGEASFIYFSWDAQRTLPRFGRLLNIID